MKKIIPFNKEIPFSNNIYEITSISLEHSLHKEQREVKGNFIISGEYRITETSVNTEKFNYDLPFSIDIDDRYNIDNVEIDINDFYYEILDNKSLIINIEVKLDNVEEIIEKDDNMKIDNNEEELVNIPNIIEELVDSRNSDDSSLKEEKRCIEEEENCDDDNHKRSIDEDVKSIFSNMSDENYVTYCVYIVRENDTIESIMDKYKVTREEVEMYNDLKEVKIGDKIIIPYVKN